MILEAIRLRDFRNIGSARLAFPPAGALITGGNGEGKTNLLEAIGLLASGRSFRRAPPQALCRHGAEGFTVEGRSRATELPHDIAFHGAPAGLRARLNGKDVGAVSALGFALAAVVCTPDTLRLAQGGPQERRRFLDWITFQRRRGHAALALEYAKAMRARNLLLRKGGDPAQLNAWEEPMARLGASIAHARRETLMHLNQALSPCLAALLTRDHQGEVRLDSPLDRDGADGASEEETAQRYRAMLREQRERDRREGGATRGPHRDDLTLWLDGHPLQRYGSQGQQKRFVLAMKLAEAALLRTVLGEPPLFLLDDPASELDGEGSARLMEQLTQSGSQLFVTACRTEEIPWTDTADYARLTVSGGVFTSR